MSLAYDIFASMESDKVPKSIDAADSALHKFYVDYSEKSKDVRGRLYAMIKKLTGEGAVNTEIKYLKVKLLASPSQLVTRVSERIFDEILFNEKVCKYDEKTLNHPIAKRCCEEHVMAITQLIDSEKMINDLITKAKGTKTELDDKDAIRVLVNLREVGKHILWSSRRLLANIRIK